MNIALHEPNLNPEEEPTHTEENFAAMFEQEHNLLGKKEGAVVRGIITGIDKDVVIVDIGIKDEGRIPIKEFVQAGKVQDIHVGDETDVYIRSYENRYGKVILSRERAVKEGGWHRLENAAQKKEPVNGIIVGRVKGGLMVDLDGVIAFLPGSQVDTKPVKDISGMMGVEQPFIVLKADREQGNIIVSRRAILEEQKKEVMQQSMSHIKLGQVLDGVVKNITDYGAFIDLGQVDGLLHVTDISWSKTAHPSEVLSVGQEVKVKVIKCDEESGRISLGMKQLQDNPWELVAAKYPVGTNLTRKITNITDYGIFIELEHGIEGLAHVSELSWTRPALHPSKVFKPGQEVECVVLEMDVNKHRIALGVKQRTDVSWQTLEDEYSVGRVLEGKVAEVLKTVLIIELAPNVTGMLHVSDISWSDSPKKGAQTYKVGEVIKAVVLSLDSARCHINLGVKQLEKDPLESASEFLKVGRVVTCTIKAINKGGIVVEVGPGIDTLIARSDLSADKVEQRPERFAVGDRVDAKIISVDKVTRRVGLSIKALELEEKKRKISTYGSVTSGATLGDVLGEAIETFALNSGEVPGMGDKDTSEGKKQAKKKN
jgi:small subunit ribosomal protein S1